MAEDLTDTVREMIKFLRNAVVELRQMATGEPEVAQQLRHVADQCETEAKELSERFGIER
jgi:hypothetical protein